MAEVVDRRNNPSHYLINICLIIFTGMEGLKRLINSTPQRETVKHSFIEAERWEALSGQNAPMAKYSQITEDLMEIHPRSLDEDSHMRKRLSEIYKDQAFKSCTQIEILIAINYLQKARLEAAASKDNWARDALGVVDSNIKALINCHHVLLQSYNSFHY
jgi:hypothetical protein